MNDLGFFCQTLAKSHVTTVLANEESLLGEIFDGAVTDFLAPSGAKATVGDAFGVLERKMAYSFSALDGVNYVCIPLPIEDKKNILFIGPYSHLPFSEERALSIADKNGLSPRMTRLLTEYLNSVTVIAENSHLFFMIDTFLERLFGTYTLTALKISEKHASFSSPIIKKSELGEEEEFIADMRMMERRYDYENEMMEAVSRGQLYKITTYFSTFSPTSFKRRVADPLREMKNYCIITNTLLRKSAERGGVHPIYLDRISSSYASRIEQIPSQVACQEMISEMFTEYCKLVQTESLKNLSPVVKECVLYLNNNLSEHLSLSRVAEALSVSKGYLSTVFRKETGQTFTDFLTKKRMDYAIHLLTTTNLQIQTVATSSGYLDMQYFSKTFKRYVGKSPRAFRE